MDRTAQVSPLGIAAIAVHQPSWELQNDWFGEAMPRKFSRHTGIESRGISLDDEVTMGLRAVRQLQAETGCDLSQCRGIMFASPSFLPPSIAHRFLTPEQSQQERTQLAARLLADRLHAPHSRVAGINWFCCGYSRALSLVSRRWAPRLQLKRDEFVLVVVASRISRITDYGNTQTAGLFGDMATATLLAPLESRRHPAHFELVHADASRETIDQPAFDFQQRDQVPVPTPDGGVAHAHDHIVYTLDGMAIAETAPRQMSAAVAAALDAARLQGSDVDFVVPHQAGTGIVRFTGMQLEGYGIGGELINGLTQHVGNVSGCSVPFALRETWNRLGGLIACPTAAVGSPGRPEVLRGCVLLRSTAYHDRQRTQAA
jgi:3-oxoacyl-[acyl-carrier-protein] synthase-3